MYKHIIIPIDLGDAGKGTSMIAAANNLAGADTHITVLNVIEDIPGYVAMELPAGLAEKNKSQSLQTLTEIVEKAGLKAEVEVRSGHPYQTILAAAEDKGADLIIVASHKPGLQDYLLGSTAARVVRHAACSVLVIR